MNRTQRTSIFPLNNSSSCFRLIDQWLTTHFKIFAAPGLSIAIAMDEKVVYKKAFGYAKLSTREQLTSDHLFRVASHSKNFVAIAIMQLVEQGKLLLSDPIGQHLCLSEYHQELYNKKWLKEITIAQLLAHRAGLSRETENADFWAAQIEFPSREQIYKVIQEQEPQIVSGGALFKYSNLGYALLQLIIEAKSGLDYNDYMKRHILSKISNKDILPEYESAIEPRLVHGHIVNLLPLICAPGSDYLNKKALECGGRYSTGAFAAATGFCATPSAMCDIYSHLCYGNESIISDESKRALYNNTCRIDKDPAQGYSLGFIVDQTIEGYYLLGHTGAFLGQRSKTLFDPLNRIVVSLAVNAYEVDNNYVIKKIYEIINLFTQKAMTMGAQSGNMDYSRYCGEFFSLFSSVFIFSVGDKVYGIRAYVPGRDAFIFPLKYIGNHCFVITEDGGFLSYGEQVKFEFDADGIARRVSINGMSYFDAETSRKVFTKKL